LNVSDPFQPSAVRSAEGHTAACGASKTFVSDSSGLTSFCAPEKYPGQSDVDHVIRDCVERNFLPVESIPAKDSCDATASKVCESAQNSAAIAPQAEDLPNPLAFFEQTSGVRRMNSLESCPASQRPEVRCYT
ncbi:hypothetical protein ANCCAN_29881, partial [Ancylostoma caninum]